MKYTIKLLNKSQVSKKISEHDERQHFVISFMVKEIIGEDGKCYSSSVVIRKDNFTKAKAKAMIKDNIKAHLNELANQEEYQLEI